MLGGDSLVSAEHGLGPLDARLDGIGVPGVAHSGYGSADDLGRVASVSVAMWWIRSLVDSLTLTGD